jgi:hypothetical protein
MLAHMRAPVDLQIFVSYVGGGGVFIQQTLEQEGPDAIYRDVRAQFYTGGSPYIKFHPDNKYGDTNIPQVIRRKPSPMIEIGLGRETLRATRGHPFWVCGEGWKMAKELAAGMRLHSTDGPVPIDRVEQVPAARPWYEQPDAQAGEDLSYNLVLDECHNFFVGPQRVLVHDNTLFPLDGPVPGVPGLEER